MLGINGAVGGLLLWFVVTRLFPRPSTELWRPTLEIRELLLFAVFGVPVYLVLVFLALTFFVGIASRTSEDQDREWWARYGGWILIAIVVWAIASFLVLLGPPLLSYAWYTYPMGGVVGVITALLGRSGKLPAKDQPSTGLSSLIMRHALPLGAMAFAAVFIVFLALATNYLLDRLTSVWTLVLGTGSWVHTVYDLTFTALASNVVSSTRVTVLFVILTAGLGFLMAWFINTNKFSHHSMYRDRIIRAYLGASNSARHPNLFTGFDSADNLSMHELRPELLHNESFEEGQFHEFLSKLRDQQDPSNHLRGILSRGTIAKLDKSASYDPGDHRFKLVERAIIRELNNALLKPEPLLPQAALGTQPDAAPQNPSDWALHNRRLLEAAFPKEIRPALDPPHRPLHIINMTLNLVRGQKLAWQQRKAQSFTVSPLHCGSFQIPSDKDDDLAYGSYRPANEYGGSKGGDSRPISLGTAMAISGAAVSPNMGYYSSPVVTFLMTLLNVRLGWWLGNPGPSGKEDYRYPYPRSAVRPIIAEALGQTDDKNKYIYLSDGGHFENLGLYEMVLRRCRFILVIDAGGDPEFQFNDLGNAVHKIRTDFGIPIDFEEMKILPRKAKEKGAFCSIGTVRYSEVDGTIGDKLGADGKPLIDKQGNVRQLPAPDGTIVYIKPVFYGDEPRDIYHYGMTHETFPHESTGDQWFSEAQFESYRKLGSLMIDKIYGRDADGPTDRAFRDSDLIGFFNKAKQSATYSVGS